ncbi:MAG: hypothetical protein BroJett040_23250 [Oligoflexia bacterium]|nr:MAG: hypothetical protein BroJett040_23250 [Oligoflexia bacterium]
MKSIVFFIACFIFSAPVLACMEKPKTIKLSQSSFESQYEMSFGVNCQPGFSISGNGLNYHFGSNSEGKKICVSVSRTKPFENIGEICPGKKLSALEQDLLTLRGDDKSEVGRIVFTDDGFRVVSMTKGKVDLQKPFVQLTTESNKKWVLSAFDQENMQIGQGVIESKLCTRSIGGEKSNGEIDLRGKSFTTSGAGCAAGIDVSPYKKSNGATFKMEGSESTGTR